MLPVDKGHLEDKVELVHREHSENRVCLANKAELVLKEHLVNRARLVNKDALVCKVDKVDLEYKVA